MLVELMWRRIWQGQTHHGVKLAATMSCLHEQDTILSWYEQDFKKTSNKLSGFGNNYFAPLLCLHTILHIYILASDLESIANKRLQHLLSLIFTSHQTTAENRLMIESLLLPRIELVPEREIPRKKMVGIATQGSGE